MKLDKQKYEKGLLTSDVRFTRAPKKLDFKTDMKILSSYGAISLKKELYEHFDYDIDTVSLPVFIRSRAKIDEFAFIELLDMMNNSIIIHKRFSYKNISSMFFS